MVAIFSKREKENLMLSQYKTMAKIRMRVRNLPEHAHEAPGDLISPIPQYSQNMVANL